MTFSRGIDVSTPTPAPLRHVGEALALSARVLELGEASIAANTRRAYASDLRALIARCAASGRPHLPASPGTVAEYLADRPGVLTVAGERGYAPSTRTRWLSAINAVHAERDLPLPGRSALVTRTLNGIRRARIRTPEQTDPLRLTDI